MLQEVISEVSKNLARGWSFSEVGSATTEQLELMALELYHCNSNKALEMVSVPEHQVQTTSQGSVAWCKCSMCQKMANEAETVCCLQNPCISILPVTC